MRYFEVKRIEAVLAAYEQEEPVTPQDLAVCKQAIERELRIKHAASDRQKDNLSKGRYGDASA